MVATIGEAYSLGWKIRVTSAWGKRDGMKSIRECVAGVTVDLETLVWTRGKDFKIARLESRMRCIRCASRRVVVHSEGLPDEPEKSCICWSRLLRGTRRGVGDEADLS